MQGCVVPVVLLDIYIVTRKAAEKAPVLPPEMTAVVALPPDAT